MNSLTRQYQSRTMLNRIANHTGQPLADTVGDRLRETIKRNLEGMRGERS